MLANPYRGYRFPEAIISQCVWLYFNLSVSLREVELMIAFRGIQLSYETIRRWCDTFGAAYAAKLKRRRPKPRDKWFLDEVFLKITGCSTICGGLSISRAQSLTIWRNPSGIVSLRCGSSESYWRAVDVGLASSSQINSVATVQPRKKFCREWLIGKAGTSTTEQKTHISQPGNENAV